MAMLATGLGAFAWEGNIVAGWRDIWTTSWANFYEKYHYGDIPMPAAPPAPPAPQTEEELRAWTPERMEAAYGPAWAQWAQDQRSAITQAEQAGTYTPAGTFPDLYTDWESSTTPLSSYWVGLTGRCGPWRRLRYGLC